ncbi:MAG: 4-alpha-glucanotransferase, partial [Paraglaciecola sp.]
MLMTYSLLEQLVEYRGIESNYNDAWGYPTTIAPATKTKLLSAMGYEVDDPDLLLKQVQDNNNDTWLSVLNPVQVLRVEEHLKIIVRLPIELVTDEYVAQIETELGDVIQHRFVPIDGQLANVAHIEDIEFQEYLIDIPITLPLGYHSLSLVIDDDELGSMRLIIAPSSCFKPGALTQGQKVWGLSVQLYCLRSDHNWGVGDFSDLSFLVEKLAKQGAQFVGLNPIHALYPANANACSPYGPSSRRWLNFIYIDVTALDGYQQVSTQNIVNDASFQHKLQQVRATDLVDYETVTALKLQALESVFEYQNSQYLS